MNLLDRQGRLETVNALQNAKPGDYIVTNTRTLHNESYVVPMADFEKNYVQDYSNINRNAYVPVGNVKNAIQMTNVHAAMLDYVCSTKETRHLNQQELLELFKDAKRKEVKKNAEIIATQLNQHLIDILKSVGGLCTFVSETNNDLITLITAPWGGTQPIYENDWLIISTEQAYVVAEAEFNLTYSIVEGKKNGILSNDKRASNCQ